MDSNYEIDFENGPVPDIKERKVIDFYSVNENGTLEKNLSQLRYYKPSNVNALNLNMNNDNIILKRNSDIGISVILNAMADNLSSIFTKNPDGEWSQPNIVCQQGLLRNFLYIPIDDGHNWKFYASKFQGTIYLNEISTEGRCCPEVMKQINDNRIACHKFRRHLTTKNLDVDPNPLEPINMNEQFNFIIQSKFNTYNIITRFIVDAVRCNNNIEQFHGEKIEFLDFKLSGVTYNSYTKQRREKYKFSKWWCQNYFSGINSIICGLTNYKTGSVLELKEFDTDEILKQGEKYWKSDNCKRACFEILKIVEESVIKDYNECLYIFYWSGKKGCNLEMKISSSELNFLPDWYIDIVNNYKRNF